MIAALRDTTMKRIIYSLAVVLSLFLTASGVAADFEVTQEKDGFTFKLDGKLLTRYLIKSGAKPILWPLMGPNGKEITRSYPIGDAKPSEKQDHIHHRSFWFTHGNVNGISFWHENDNGGQIKHRKFTKVDGGKTAVISSINDWIGPNGKKQCEDERTLTFGSDGKNVWIDFDITIKASDGKVVFGDTKEGSFGVRVAGTMKETAKQGGRIVNSRGQESTGAWGKPAEWVDYHGPVEGKTVGIAILNHPESFRFPTHWHVRNYGLFAANPFGLHDFYGRKKDIDGSHTLEPGDSFSLHYRVLIHSGDEKEGKVAEAFDAYKSVNK